MPFGINFNRWTERRRRYTISELIISTSHSRMVCYTIALKVAWHHRESELYASTMIIDFVKQPLNCLVTEAASQNGVHLFHLLSTLADLFNHQFSRCHSVNSGTKINQKPISIYHLPFEMYNRIVRCFFIALILYSFFFSFTFSGYAIKNVCTFCVNIWLS